MSLQNIVLKVKNYRCCSHHKLSLLATTPPYIFQPGCRTFSSLSINSKICLINLSLKTPISALHSRWKYYPCSILYPISFYTHLYQFLFCFLFPSTFTFNNSYSASCFLLHSYLLVFILLPVPYSTFTSTNLYYVSYFHLHSYLLFFILFPIPYTHIYQFLFCFLFPCALPSAHS